MKKLFTLSTMLFCFIAFTQAQDGSREAFVDLLAQETCTCLSDKDLSEIDPSNVEMTVGMCILNSFSEHSDEFPDINLDISNARAMEQLGEEIGFKMFNHCPALLMQIAGASGGLSDEDMELMEMPPPPPSADSFTSEGTFVRVDGGDLAKVVIKNTDGEKITLLWFIDFNGADLLMGDVESLKGKNVSYSYDTIETYDPTAGKYVERKVISNITFLD